MLGVAANASADDIRTAFRTLAKAVHPDQNKSHDAEEAFLKVSPLDSTSR